MSLRPLRCPSVTLQAGPQVTRAGSSTSDSWPDLHHLRVLQPNAALKQMQKGRHQEIRDSSPNQAGRQPGSKRARHGERPYHSGCGPVLQRKSEGDSQPRTMKV